MTIMHKNGGNCNVNGNYNEKLRSQRTTKLQRGGGKKTMKKNNIVINGIYSEAVEIALKK